MLESSRITNQPIDGHNVHFDRVRIENAKNLHSYNTGFFISLKSIVLWITMTSVTFILGFVTIVLALIRAQFLMHRLASFWGRSMSAITGSRIIIHGAENLYTSGSSLVIANHQSMCDIFILYGVLRKIQFRWMAKKSLFRIPIIGWAMTGAGYIPVDRSNKKKAMQSMFDAAKEIKKGKSVIVFPEGTTGHNDGRMIPFKKGAFLLAKKAQSTIQPISQFGANHIMPEQNGRWIQRIYKGDVHVYIHEAIPPEKYADKDLNEISDMVREIIEKPITENHLKK